MNTRHLNRRAGLLRWLTRVGVFIALLGIAQSAVAVRVKDLASVAGVRDNQLVGYGLVVGLDGTGEDSEFTVQSLRNMLNQLGVRVPANVRLSPKNVAAVALHATLPPFAKPGQRIDVTASTLGDAKSLRGGTLLVAPLRGMNGEIYAVAQGNLIVSGFGAATNDGNKISVNVPTVGRVPNGATIERAAPTQLSTTGDIVLHLHRPDFTTASRLTDAINRHLQPGTAQAIDATSIRIRGPRNPDRQVAFLSAIERVDVRPGDAPARVIVNSRTGTVIIGQYVAVSAAAVAHGNLSLVVSNTTEVSQPPPLSEGQTVVVPNSSIELREEEARAFVFEPGVSLESIVQAINRVGASPSDLVAILEALRAAGALRAELVVI